MLGNLNFASRVIISGRPFVSYLIDLSTHVKELHHYLTLTKECRVDLQFWFTFFKSDWNGLNMFYDWLTWNYTQTHQLLKVLEFIIQEIGFHPHGPKIYL